MSTLDKSRGPAREALLRLVGEARPEWRTAFTTDGTDEPTGIIPVCSDPDHEPDDGSVYVCCPEPAIEVGATELAEYLVALLNADREEKGTRGGSPQQGESTHEAAQAGGAQ
ncbi:hypothetical protein [Streptomyces sp. NBC_01373]|uniref:hypothetical protein n=1 Tax=Streptomyces sp. NBC_01373 TaxID=2903843 RepID=UPI00224F8C4E|nr:hypothetical protein [Streptomyces sp. NBC_01373]MCX4705690.1 hypothetical protein [Streptomyces sp. NBC_01373]